MKLVKNTMICTTNWTEVFCEWGVGGRSLRFEIKLLIRLTLEGLFEKNIFVIKTKNYFSPFSDLFHLLIDVL